MAWCGDPLGRQQCQKRALREQRRRHTGGREGDTAGENCGVCPPTEGNKLFFFSPTEQDDKEGKSTRKKKSCEEQRVEEGPRKKGRTWERRQVLLRLQGCSPQFRRLSHVVTPTGTSRCHTKLTQAVQPGSHGPLTLLSQVRVTGSRCRAVHCQSWKGPQRTFGVPSGGAAAL